MLGNTVQGKLELIVGPMRSNKTAELLRRIETRRQYAKQHVLLLKPSDDTKAAAGLVESRNQNGCGKMEAVEFRSADPWTVLPVLAATEQQIGKRVECVAIDEGQFVQDLFPLHQAPARIGLRRHGLRPRTRFSRHALRRNDRSLLAGAHLFRKHHRTGGLLQLRRQGHLPAAAIDGKPAPYDSPIIMAGDFYEPRCAEHFVLPGRPH